MKHILCALSIVMCFFVTTANATDKADTFKGDTLNTKTEDIRSSMTVVERKVREAAVKIVSPTGHGSGSLVEYKDVTVILTAQHVAHGEIGDFYGIIKGDQKVIGILIYSDQVHDIAVIYAPVDLPGATPMKFNPRDDIATIGTEVTYSGYPSDHQLMTFRGSVAGYEDLARRGRQIILHTHGWFGSSGSGVYDSKGRMVGVLWGIDVERPESIQIIDNIIWISPIKNLDISKALRTLCIAFEPKEKLKACN